MLSQFRKDCEEEETDDTPECKDRYRLLIAMLSQIRRLVLGISTSPGGQSVDYERIEAIITAALDAVECFQICPESLDIIRGYTIDAITLVVTPGWSKYGLPELYELIERSCAGMHKQIRGLCMINYILLRRLVQ
jgi:hypothetical protein